jgi:hypothetical protein
MKKNLFYLAQQKYGFQILERKAIILPRLVWSFIILKNINISLLKNSLIQSYGWIQILDSMLSQLKRNCLSNTFLVKTDNSRSYVLTLKIS